MERPGSWRWFSGLLCVFFSTPFTSAQTVRLNGPLATQSTSDVQGDYRFDASGNRVLFRADPDVDERFDLFVAPSDASAPARRLNAPLPENVGVQSFELGAGGFVVYLADESVATRFELYGVALAGGEPVRLSGLLVGGGDVARFQLTPDGTQVVFLADARVNNHAELFRAPVDGSAPVLPLEPSPSPNPIRDFRIHPDGSRAVVIRPVPDLFRERLGSLALDGSGATVFLAYSAGPVFSATAFSRVEVAPDGLSVIAADVDDLDGDVGFGRLYGIPMDGSRPAATLNQELELFDDAFVASASTGRVAFIDGSDLVSTNLDGSGRVQLDFADWSPTSDEFALTPDGSRLIFNAFRPGIGQLTLFVVPIDGSAPAANLGASIDVRGCVLTDSTVYHVANSSFGALLAQPLAGGAPLLLNGPATPSFGVTRNLLERTPAGEILFVQRAVGSPGSALHVVPGDGSLAPRRFGPVLVSPQSISTFRASADGSRVAYLANRSNPVTLELFPAALGATPPDRPYLTLPLGPVEGDVQGFRVAPDGQSLVYRADQARLGDFQLFHSKLSGSSGALTSVSLVLPEFAFSPSSQHVVFQHPFGELFSAVNGAGSPHAHLEYARVPTPFAFTPDGMRVVFEQRIIGQRRLRSVPVGGSSSSTLLLNLAATDDPARRFEITADGRFVVLQELGSLSSVPITGGAVRSLSNLVTSFQVSPDAKRVLFRRRSGGRDTLLAVGIEQGSAVQVNAPLAAGKSVLDFALTSAGTRVVYRGEAAQSGAIDLFGATLQGPAAVSPLSSPLGTQAVQPDYRIGADGRRVVYRADADTAGVLELYSAPIDGSAAPTQLNAALAGGQVDSFAITPDARRVVYLASPDGLSARELFVVPILGGTAVRLDPRPAFSDVGTYRIDPGSQLVYYLCGRNLNDAPELYAVPLDGTDAPRRVNDVLPEGGEVFDDFVPLARSRVVFRADQEKDDVVELFLGTGVRRRKL